MHYISYITFVSTSLDIIPHLHYMVTSSFVNNRVCGFLISWSGACLSGSSHRRLHCPPGCLDLHLFPRRDYLETLFAGILLCSLITDTFAASSLENYEHYLLRELINGIAIVIPLLLLHLLRIMNIIY